MFDYSQAPTREVIPAGTVASVLMRILPGECGEDNLLKRSEKGDCEMLRLEFVVTDGEFQRRKFWQNLILEGTTDGHAKAAAISRGLLRGIIESVRGIKPNDMSTQARAARTVSLKDFDNLQFIGKIGVEKGNGNYPDKNVLAAAVTPDQKQWRRVDQASPRNDNGNAQPTAAAPQSGGVAKPTWAT